MLALSKRCVGAVLTLCWRYSGVVLALCWHCAGAVLAQFAHVSLPCLTGVFNGKRNVITRRLAMPTPTIVATQL